MSTERKPPWPRATVMGPDFTYRPIAECSADDIRYYIDYLVRENESIVRRMNDPKRIQANNDACARNVAALRQYLEEQHAPHLDDLEDPEIDMSAWGTTVEDELEANNEECERILDERRLQE